MNASLGTYLNDHLAGAAFALKLLSRLAHDTSDLALRELALRLHREISHDRQQLEAIAARIGSKPSRLKNVVARLGEKLSRLKLGHTSSGNRGTFEALEALALGILGKLALWTALESINHPQLSDIDFSMLKQRALEQHAEAENHRLRMARLAFAPAERRTNAG